MEVLNLVIISVTSRNLRINGFNSMMKEWESSILMILNIIVMEDNIGEDKVRMPISWFMRKFRRNLLSYNFQRKKSKMKFWINLIWTILFLALMFKWKKVRIIMMKKQMFLLKLKLHHKFQQQKRVLNPKNKRRKKSKKKRKSRKKPNKKFQRKLNNKQNNKLKKKSKNKEKFKSKKGRRKCKKGKNRRRKRRKK